jgi:F-type H+-transporting ATPase subunit epsilon
MSEIKDLKVISTNKVIFKGSAKKIVIPTLSGEITVLNNHVPIISVIKKGEIKIVDSEDNTIKLFEVDGGVVDVRKSGEVVVMLA